MGFLGKYTFSFMYIATLLYQLELLLLVLPEFGNFLQNSGLCYHRAVEEAVTWSLELLYVVRMCPGPYIHITSAQAFLYPYF